MTSIIHPISTEKSIRMMEAENKLVFMVQKKATKAMIKKDVEELLKVKVTHVNTLNGLRGKKAVVTFSQDTPAIDVAAKLGLM
jgi:large subunit ribosomal protein L23